MSETLITVEAFCGMLGVSRFWYYDHKTEPDLPKRVYVGKEPRLALSECEAYVEHLKNKRPPEGPPARRQGRPAKAVIPPSRAASSPRS